MQFGLTVEILLLVTALPLALGCAAPVQAGLRQVWAVDDGEKIFREDIKNPLKSGEGNSVWDGKTVRLFAARNEVVAFQLILEAGEGGAKGINVTVSDLTNGEARIRGSHPLPKPGEYAGIGVELFTEHYLHVTTPSYNDPEGGGFNWTAAANPKLTGWIPDALIPLSAKPGKGGAPFDIAPNTNQGVWVDIYVPKEKAPAGSYNGTIEVTGGERTVQIPIALEVLDFALPDENHYRCMIFYSDSNIGARHGLRRGAELYDMILQYHQMAHRHRIELIGQGSWGELEALKGTVTGEAFTRANGYQGPGEGVGNTVFSINTYRVRFPDNEEGYRRESDRWVKWFEENAPGVEYFLYLIDEPRRDRFEWIKERAGWIHENPGVGRKLPLFVTKWPLEGLTGAVDIWCAPISHLPKDAYDAARARGERVWVYQAYRPRTPGDTLDEYGIAFRVKAWISHKVGFGRWFTWESTHWHPNPNEKPNDRPKNIFVDPVIFTSGTPYTTGNGDGSFFYPGEDRVFTDQDRGYRGPMSSIRMKMYRRGVQDVEYMWLAGRAGAEKAVKEVLDELLPAVMWEAGELPSWSNHNAVYEGARRRLADLIVKK